MKMPELYDTAPDARKLDEEESHEAFRVIAPASFTIAFEQHFLEGAKQKAKRESV